MKNNKLDKAKNKRLKDLEKKLEIKIKQFEKVNTSSKIRKKTCFSKHFKLCTRYIVILLRSKIFYFFSLLVFLLLVKVLGLVDVFKVANDFLIRALGIIGS